MCSTLVKTGVLQALPQDRGPDGALVDDDDLER